MYTSLLFYQFQFLKVRPTLQGTLCNHTDSFDHARHRVRFKATLGRRHNKTSEEVKVEKVEAVSNVPLPLSFEDLKSDTVNDALLHPTARRC